MNTARHLAHARTRAMILRAQHRAAALMADADCGCEDPEPQHIFAALSSGTPFEALVAIVGKETADGRVLNSVRWGESVPLPVRVRWQMASSDGHNGAELVGQVDSFEQRADGSIMAFGLLAATASEMDVESGEVEFEGPAADLACQLSQGLPWGVSIGGGYADISVPDPDAPTQGPVVYDVEITEVTITSDPAEPATWVRLAPAPAADSEPTLADRVTQAAAVLAEALTALTAPVAPASPMPAGVAASSTDPLVRPPAEWFEPFETTAKFTVVPDGPERGRCFGVVAPASCHLGMLDGGCVTPTGDGLPLLIHFPGRFTTSGQINTAPIISGIGHRFASAAETLAHYSDRDDAVGADVRYAWLPDGSLAAFGAVRPGTTDEQIAAMNASATSYHRSKFRRGQELVPGQVMDHDGWFVAGVCFVASPGHAPHGSTIAASSSRGPVVIEHPGHVLIIGADEAAA